MEKRKREALKVSCAWGVSESVLSSVVETETLCKYYKWIHSRITLVGECIRTKESLFLYQRVVPDIKCTKEFHLLQVCTKIVAVRPVLVEVTLGRLKIRS